ncbi:MAG: Ig-like domain-containing protein [Dysgonamonadaceae bacterium]|jgi:hypothetical protein|nr:Ig-like domain-containing protein [Dysgonamonadaceae bacterium]
MKQLIKNIAVFTCIFSIMVLFSSCSNEGFASNEQGFTVSNAEITLGLGETQQIYASIYPYKSEEEDVKWSSNKPDIASIEDEGTHHGISSGKITALSVGEATVTIESTVNSAKKGLFKVHVVEHTFNDLAQGENYSSDDLITYRVPDEYPQEGKPLFNISVNGKYTGVYTDINAWKNLVSFGYFDFTPGKEVEIAITVNKPFYSYKILPESSPVSSTQKGNIIYCKLKEADKTFSLVFNDDYKGNTLHVFANSIDLDAPTQSENGLVYFGPGYHDIAKIYGGNGKLSISGNRKVYIAGGAVVEGSIAVSGNGNVVSGRGILMKSTPNDLVITASYAKNVTCNGFIACSHRDGGWTFGMHEASNITVKNFKIVSSRYASTDGFDIVNSNNIQLSNVFIRACDDAIAIKGLINRLPAECPANENMLFENIQLWNDCNNAMCLGAETRAKWYDNIRFKDIDVIFSYDDRDHHTLLDERSVMTIVSLDGTYFRNITWENIRVNRCERLICLTFKDSFWFGSIQGNQSTEGGIDGVTFKNVGVSSNSGSSIANEILLNGWYGEGTPAKIIKNITFDNVTIEGKHVRSEQDTHLKTNNTAERKLVTNLNFK